MFSQQQDQATHILDVISHSPAQTQRLGMRLGDLLRGGELILLEGQLGSGKTTFTQGLAKGLGIEDVISSPTFTLLKEYQGQPRLVEEAVQNGDTHVSLHPQVRPPLYHFDLYRLDEPDEVLALGFEDYFYDSGVSVVEWADKADVIWPHEHLRVRIKLLSETKRGILFTAVGDRYSSLLHQFQKNTYASLSS